MAENTDKIISGLKGIIDENGPDYPKRGHIRCIKGL